MGMADWAHSRLAHLPRTQLDQMWKIYIGGEYNAMPVVLADLYAITGNEDCLVTAECFVNTYLFDAAIKNQDILDGEHANQHIPQYAGYLRDLRLRQADRLLQPARLLHRRRELLGHGGAAPHLRGRRHGGHRRDLRGQGCHRRHHRGLERRRLPAVQHAEAEQAAVLPQPGPEVHAVLRARAVRADHLPAAERQQRHRPAGHLLPAGRPRRGPGLPGQPRRLRRRHGARGQHQVPGVDLLPLRGRLDALRQPVHGLDPDLAGARPDDRAVDQLPARPVGHLDPDHSGHAVT